VLPQREKEGRKGELGGETELGTAMAGGQRRGVAVDGCREEVARAIYSPWRERMSKRGRRYDGDVGSRSSVRFWITLVVGGARHTDPASDPKTRIQQS